MKINRKTPWWGKWSWVDKARITASKDGGAWLPALPFARINAVFRSTLPFFLPILNYVAEESLLIFIFFRAKELFVHIYSIFLATEFYKKIFNLDFIKWKS